VVEFPVATQITCPPIYRVFIPVLKGLVLLSIPLSPFKYAWPDLFEVVFPASAVSGRCWLASRMTLPRAAGVFGHPNQLAFVTAAMSGVCLLRAQSPKGNPRCSARSLLVLAGALKRQEIVRLAVLFPVSLRSDLSGSQRGREDRCDRRGVGRCSSGGCVCAANTAGLSGLSLQTYWRPVGFQDGEGRSYADGLLPASRKFRLGVVFGGSGGYAYNWADSPYCTYLGFSNFSWYREVRYLTDTFRPHVCA
jgi:hypothetical protein